MLYPDRDVPGTSPSAQVDESRGRSSMDGLADAAHGLGLSAAADTKQSAFQIAVSVAHASEHKVCPNLVQCCVVVATTSVQRYMGPTLHPGFLFG